MSISLYNIEDSLQQLTELRESAELEGDSEALKVIDQQIREYLTKEAAKVTSYVGLIRSREMTALACSAEIDRLQNIKRQALADVERLKDNALATMQAFDVKELRATPGGGLRRQGNGGLQALEVDADALPDSLKVVSLNIHLDVWRAIQQAFDGDPRFQAGTTFGAHITQPNQERIREAMKHGEKIPGAKLLPRGEHVRVI